MFKLPTLANRLLNGTSDTCTCESCVVRREAAREIERLTKLLEHRPVEQPDFTDTRVES